MSIRKGRILASAGKVEIRASAGKMESGLVPKKGRNPNEYRKSGIRASTGEGWIQASSGKGRIRVSAGKVEIWASAGKVESRRVPKRWDPSEYWRRVRVSIGKG